MAVKNTVSSRVADEDKYSRRRVIVLVLVHIAVGLHILHWKQTGRTVAPLELNEVVYTFAVGIVTAGFLLLVAATIASAIFGRYFCSWACHIIAWQDLFHWLLGKFGIKLRPLRSRALRLVPFIAALYMFAAPLVARMIAERSWPSFHLRSDAEGWASLVTSDFWRNLPGGWITLATLGTCGFVIVYALGSRAFCTTVCPYGALFAAADRVAPGRLISQGNCSGCARCTRVCSSHIKVHQEIADFGMIVDKDCLRDLDCMAVCPNENIRFGWTTPPLLRDALTRRGLTRRFDLTLGEELLLVGACAAAFFALRGLYDALPFLLSIALAVVFAGLVVLLARVVRRRDSHFQKFDLVRAGRVRTGGVVFAGFSGGLVALILHSGYVRWHEFGGQRALAEAEATGSKAALAEAREHVDAVRRWGLFDSRAARLRQARVAELAGDLAAAEKVLVELDRSKPNDRFVVLPLARVWNALGRPADAAGVLDRGLAAVPEIQHDRADVVQYLSDVHALRGEIAAQAGELELARQHLVEACELAPRSALAQYQLGVVWGALGDKAKAKACFARSVELAPNDVDALNNLGFLLLDEGALTEAEAHLRRAVTVAPSMAMAHFNLGRALLALGRTDDARRELKAACELDASFVDPVRRVLGAR